MRFRLIATSFTLSAALAAQSSGRAGQDALVHMNQIQVIGTHNSYHAGFAPGEAALMRQKNPKAFDSLDYSHPPLDVQLSNGVRQIEIDIYADPKGGRFAHPAITGMTAAAHLPVDPPLDSNHELDRPGFKVLHVAGIDQRSTCLTFVACLQTVHAWSAAHPSHLPVFILVETKYDPPTDPPKPYAVPTEPFTPALFDSLDAEILSVFAAGELITPDLVRGSHATLPEAIAAEGWPTLAQARGKVVFLLDQANMTPVYTENHPALRGRILFTNSTPGTSDAAFVERNDGTPAEIQALVRQGLLVRTRTDEPTGDARANNTTSVNGPSPPARNFFPPTILQPSRPAGTATTGSHFQTIASPFAIPSTGLPRAPTACWKTLQDEVAPSSDQDVSHLSFPCKKRETTLCSTLKPCSSAATRPAPPPAPSPSPS